MAPIMGVISALRNLRSELQIPPSRTLTAIVRPPAGTVAASLQETAASIAALARAEIQVDPEATRPPRSLLAIAEGCEVYVPVEGVVDIEAERGRLSRELRASTRISAASRPSSPGRTSGSGPPPRWWPGKRRAGRAAGAPGEAP